VIPGENGELIQTSDEIPTGSDISKEEDSNCEDRERLHLLEAEDRGAREISQSHGRGVGYFFRVEPPAGMASSEVSSRHSSVSVEVFIMRFKVHSVYFER
jgi:hypothetical protein